MSEALIDSVYSEESVHSVYCEESDQLVALDGRFCRACRRQLDEEDRRHSEVTPQVLRHNGYVTTPEPERAED
jgi:hypothetical protein